MRGAQQGRLDPLRSVARIRSGSASRFPCVTDDLDIGAPLQLVSEWVTMRMHRGDDRRVLGEERPNRIAEPLRGDLTGQESANGDLGLAERGDQPLGEGALADPGAALEKQALRGLSARRCPSARRPRARGP